MSPLGRGRNATEPTGGQIQAFQREIHDGRVLLLDKVVYREPLDVKYQEWRQPSDFVPPQLSSRFLKLIECVRIFFWYVHNSTPNADLCGHSIVLGQNGLECGLWNDVLLHGVLKHRWGWEIDGKEEKR